MKIILTKKLSSLLLDSSLISPTNNQSYDYKVISCGSYVQLYKFENRKIKKDNNKELLKDIKNINTDKLFKKNNIENKEHNIDLKNIMRSKLECQRLAKSNAEVWKTFITLTFAENITNIKIANMKFRYFVDKIRRIYKDFKYICIPEFQKRGAVHYHLLSNIDINNTSLVYSQENNNYFKHIKYWNEGFTKVDELNNDIKKIVGYISKYMTKDIDNRLFNHHRYLYSKNLIKPSSSYLNSQNIRHASFLNKILQNKNLIYSNTYYDSFYNDIIAFEEYLIKDDNN